MGYETNVVLTDLFVRTTSDLMRTVAITELKAHLAKYLRLARRGEEVQVLDRGVPVARLVGLGEDLRGDDARLQRLVRSGILRPASAAPGTLVALEPLDLPSGLSEALSAEREDRLLP